MRKTRFALTAAVAAALAIPAAAQAEVDTTSITIGGGALTFTQQPLADDFAATTLTGAPQVVTTALQNWNVNDATGSGAGWNVTFAASPFDDGAGHTIPAGSLTMTAPVPTPVGVNLAVPPLPSGALFTLDNGAVEVVSAAALTGQGEWLFTQAPAALALNIPANAFAGTYTSNLTFTLSTGP